ncbi:MAG: glycerol-3-phosphate ABC transporter ATP-binding protein [Deltaproteobacteria bacterium]|nr:MAG: glycerol-3-phosphate ABC transporter ATP-binding protein [Deltaproteobacteria bacterium]
MAQVKLEKIVKNYGSVEVVHGVDIAIEDSEFIVLVGPSGCGKSTILRMIAGLESISGGKIIIGDKVVNQVSPRDRNVAMVFQNYALYPHMTVRENMAFSLKMAKVPKKQIDEKVALAAATLELGDYLQRKPAALSGGQRQRVAMGRAIVRQPDVFLFDEPLSNLDAQLRTQMRMELKKLHLKFKTTTIYVTHDQIEAMTLADRIVILKDGRIQQIGTPVEVFEHPANVFVARFIGNPPMNILPAKFRLDGGNPSLVMGGLVLPLPGEKGKNLADGDEVLMGIRPDAIKIRDVEHRFAPEWCREAEVIVAEILGGQSLLELDAGQNKLLAEVEGRLQARPGEKITVGFELDRVVLFDPATTEAIC